MDTFEVQVSDLEAGVRWLGADARAVDGAGARGAGGASAASGAVNGGPLAAASNRLAEVMVSRSGELGEALAGSGRTLASNAERYVADDASAGAALAGIDFEGPAW